MGVGSRIKGNKLNPNTRGQGGVGILLAYKYARLGTVNGALYENIVVWIKL